MRLAAITATPDVRGNRIDLTWTGPGPTTGVRVVRREGTHPTGPTDGTTVAEGLGLAAATDTALRGETTYYYTLFPYSGSPRVYAPDPHNRTSATATSPYGFADRLYDLLPAIYRRYDAEGAPPGQETGQLRRFLDLPGGELDRLYSRTRAALAFADPDRVDGALLPLLAQWIGWRTDVGLPVGTQRDEVHRAPSIYRTVGVLPTVDATVARVTGWANRTKEFVHNVARTNEPERLNLWSATRTGATFTESTLASINHAVDGRPAAVRDNDGSTLVFQHTARLHGWDIWAKRFAGGTWQPSFPVVDRPGIDKHPTAAMVGTTLWLFWQSYDPDEPAATRRWRISFSTRTGTTWSKPEVLGDPATERRMPVAVSDGTGVWLFWTEAGGLRHRRNDGTTWGPVQTMPADGGAAPRVEDDLFALVMPTAGKRLWLFWARREPGGPPGQTRWSLVYRIKAALDPTANDWSPIRVVAKRGAGEYHDRQPAALPTAGGDVELFWASKQNGGWSVCSATLAAGPLTFGATQQVTTGPFTRRAPLPVDVGGGTTLLLHRSNASIARDSTTFGATHTLDHRYAGTTTADVADTAKLALRGTFEDFTTYTYDTGRGNDARIARDTVGLYLTPDTADPDEIATTVSRLAGVLPAFLPVATRAVYVTD